MWARWLRSLFYLFIFFRFYISSSAKHFCRRRGKSKVFICKEEDSLFSVLPKKMNEKEIDRVCVKEDSFFCWLDTINGHDSNYIFQCEHVYYLHVIIYRIRIWEVMLCLLWLYIVIIAKYLIYLIQMYNHNKHNITSHVH